MTDTITTRLRCGEHSLPLTYTAGRGVHCERGCDLTWSDLRPEAGERIERMDSGALFVVSPA